nr:hypothetical protein [Duganella sp. Leaf126]
MQIKNHFPPIEPGPIAIDHGPRVAESEMRVKALGVLTGIEAHADDSRRVPDCCQTGHGQHCSEPGTVETLFHHPPAEIRATGAQVQRMPTASDELAVTFDHLEIPRNRMRSQKHFEFLALARGEKLWCVAVEYAQAGR